MSIKNKVDPYMCIKLLASENKALKQSNLKLIEKIKFTENKLEENVRINKLLLSKFVDIDLFMDSDIKLKLSETVNLIAQKQVEQNIEMLSQPEAKVLTNLVGSLNDERNKNNEAADRVNSLEKLVIELKREIEQYWGGQRRINDVDIDYLHTKNTSLQAQLEYSERWRLALEKSLTKQMRKMRQLLEDNPHLQISKPK